MIEKAGRPGVAFARLGAIWMIVEAGRPARGIDLGHGVGARGQQFPERLQPGGSGKSASSVDDRDQTVTHGDEVNSTPWRESRMTARFATQPSLHASAGKDQFLRLGLLAVDAHKRQCSSNWRRPAPNARPPSFYEYEA